MYLTQTEPVEMVSQSITYSDIIKGFTKTESISKIYHMAKKSSSNPLRSVGRSIYTYRFKTSKRWLRKPNNACLKRMHRATSSTRMADEK